MADQSKCLTAIKNNYGVLISSMGSCNDASSYFYVEPLYSNALNRMTLKVSMYPATGGAKYYLTDSTKNGDLSTRQVVFESAESSIIYSDYSHTITFPATKKTMAICLMPGGCGGEANGAVVAFSVRLCLHGFDKLLRLQG